MHRVQGAAGRNLPLLYVMALLQGMVFYSPVATLYRQAAGISLLQMGVIESLSLALALGLEIPWGFAADRLGHRRTVVICTGIYAVSKVVFWRAETFGGFLAERLLLSAAVSGLSGCDSALLYASCGPAGDHRRAFSHWSACQTAGLLAAGLLWPLLGGQYRLAALLTVFTYSGALLCALFLAEPERGSARAERTRGGFAAALRRTGRILPLLLAFCLMEEAGNEVTIFLSQLQYLRAGIPQALFGPAFALVTAAGLLGGASHRLTRRLGVGRTGTLLFLLAGAACLGMALWSAPVLALAGVVTAAICRAVMAPISLSLQNEGVEGGGRALQLSCNAMVVDLGAAALYPAFGACADRGVSHGLLLAAGCCLGGLVLFRVGLRGAQPAVDRG